MSEKEKFFSVSTALQSQQWEITKGHLRALVAMRGCYSSKAPSSIVDWQELDKRVEAFIRKLEGEGLVE